MQAKYFLGISVPRNDQVWAQLRDIFSVIGKTQWRELVMSLSWLFLLLLLKNSGKRYK